jgi:hypothetical protein
MLKEFINAIGGEEVYEKMKANVFNQKERNIYFYFEEGILEKKAKKDEKSSKENLNRSKQKIGLKDFILKQKEIIAKVK